MRTVQYFYLNGINGNPIRFPSTGELISGQHITHLGIQMPFRPFMSWRAKEIAENDMPTRSDIEINSVKYDINPNGILEFDDIYLTHVEISFPMSFDTGVTHNASSILKETIVEIGVSSEDE